MQTSQAALVAAAAAAAVGRREQAIAVGQTTSNAHRCVQIVQQVAGDSLVSGGGSPRHIDAAGAAGGAADGPQRLPRHGSRGGGRAGGLLQLTAERGSGAPHQERPERALGEAAHCSAAGSGPQRSALALFPAGTPPPPGGQPPGLRLGVPKHATPPPSFLCASPGRYTGWVQGCQPAPCGNPASAQLERLSAARLEGFLGHRAPARQRWSESGCLRREQGHRT